MYSLRMDDERQSYIAMKATEYFDINMTSNEVRKVFFTKFKEASSAQELAELEAAYSAVSKVIFDREMQEAVLHNRMC